MEGFITERSRRGGISSDAFTGIPWSYQYSENLNVFGDSRGLKLSSQPFNEITAPASVWGSRFVQMGTHFCVIPREGGAFRIFKAWDESWTQVDEVNIPESVNIQWVAYLNDTLYFTAASDDQSEGYIYAISINRTYNTLNPEGIPSFGDAEKYKPKDITTFEEEGQTIEWGEDDTNLPDLGIGAVPSVGGVMLAMMNNFLFVANGNYLWRFIPAENKPDEKDTTWWTVYTRLAKGSKILAMTTNWNYIKLYVRQSNWENQILYFPVTAWENNKLTRAANAIDIKNQRIKEVYSDLIDDFIITEDDDTGTAVSLNRMINFQMYEVISGGGVSITQDKLFDKAPTIVWPLSWNMATFRDRYYFADAQGVWEMVKSSPVPLASLKWKWEDNDTSKKPWGILIVNGFLIVSRSDNKIYQYRLTDTGNDYYMGQGLLIGRVQETEYGGMVTKWIQSIMAQYEFDQSIATGQLGKIEIYVATNRKWSNPTTTDSWWKKVLTIEANERDKCRIQATRSFADQGREPFEMLEYMVVITRWSSGKSTPIFRWLSIEYNVESPDNR